MSSEPDSATQAADWELRQRLRRIVIISLVVFACADVVVIALFQYWSLSGTGPPVAHANAGLVSLLFALQAAAESGVALFLIRRPMARSG